MAKKQRTTEYHNISISNSSHWLNFPRVIRRSCVLTFRHQQNYTFLGFYISFFIQLVDMLCYYFTIFTVADSFVFCVARSLLRPMTSLSCYNYKGRRVLDIIISLRGNRFDVGYLFRAVSAPRVYVNNWTADERRNTFQPTNQTFIAVSPSQWLLKCSVGGMVGLGFFGNWIGTNTWCLGPKLLYLERFSRFFLYINFIYVWDLHHRRGTQYLLLIGNLLH